MGSANIGKHAQIVYLSHGGGPLPLLGDPSHAGMIRFMKDLPTQLHRPDAIIVISAHWEERVATVQSATAPRMFYDYYGFPEEAYSITYPAPGNRVLADRVAHLLNDNGLPSQLDEKRGFDHGLFIPLKMMYPNADIPSFQLSLLNSLDAKAHVGIGKALSSLMDENILIIGSGFSFHNLRAFRFDGEQTSDPKNDAFQEWLMQVCVQTKAQAEREAQLINWEQAPNAMYCHPREEHLLPLHVCVGMARTEAQLVFNDYIAGKRAVAFLWK